MRVSLRVALTYDKDTRVFLVRPLGVRNPRPVTPERRKRELRPNKDGCYLARGERELWDLCSTLPEALAAEDPEDPPEPPRSTQTPRPRAPSEPPRSTQTPRPRSSSRR